MRKFYLFILITLSSQLIFAQTIRYVKPAATGTGDGLTWANASANLQDMINASALGDEVWVAAGTYKPTEKLQAITYVASPGTGVATTDRDKAFIMKGGVKVYGGFIGTEGLLSERNYTANTTILSGDLNNDNIASDGDCYHVVSARNSADDAVLDGFTIQHGFANGTAVVSANGTTGTSSTTVAQNVGAGIAVRGTNTAIKWSNLIVKDNESFDVGGGAYVRISGTDVVFQFDNVKFSNNKTFSDGGGLYVYASLDQPILKMNKVVFVGNSTSSTLTGASDGSGGGGLFLGGATAASFLRYEIVNSVFFDNASARPTGGGAAAYLASYTNGTIASSTFYKNLAVGAYGAIGFNNGSSTTFRLYNNIFNQNSTDIRSGTAAVQDLRYNLFQVNYSTSGSRTTSNNLTNAAPTSLFVSTTSTDADFLTLTTGSIALDAGSNTLSTALVDLANNTRIRNTTIDLGAYEFQTGNAPLPVKLDSYTATKKGLTAVLSWKTVSEQNNEKFVIERGSSANNFTFFKSVAGAGDSNTPLSYSITDFAPLVGANYYRLSQVDKDGKSEILGTQAVSFEMAAAKAQVYPNPAKNYIEVKPSSSNGIVSLNLISLTGQNISTNIYAQAVLNESVKLDLTSIPSGTYILWINKGKSNAEKQTLLVVK